MMQNPRVLLWIGLALVLWLNYEAWVKDYTPRTATSSNVAGATTSTRSSTSPGLGDSLPEAGPDAAAIASSGPAISPAMPTGTAALPTAPVVSIKTDVFDIDISLEGGTIQRADLLRYPKVKGGTEPVRLMDSESAEKLYSIQSGLKGPSGAVRPTHLAPLESAQRNYELDGKSELRVPLTWSDGNGVEVIKTYIFRRGEYRIDVDYEVRNGSAAAWVAGPYARILRNDPPTKRSMFNVESYAFHGPAIYDGTKYRNLDVEDENDQHLSIDVPGGWVAALQHHFVGAIIPAREGNNRYTLKTQGRDYLLAVTGPMISIAAGSTGHFNEAFFIGPKLQVQLAKAGPRLELVANYGKYLTVLAKPLFWLLGKVHALLGNWGWAIIIVTFLLKLLFYPLSEASGKSMAKMKVLSPRIKNLQETHKGDREKLGRAMMELYQREKINPVAGCLPIVIQIPVFLAFYWVLLESVEMRQAPFMGWINDLSSRDPYFILPAIMAGAMFIQYKLNPAPPDPIQAKMFMIMPLVMSVTFAFFPAGLVLYWVTNTVLSIAQQWNINRRIEASKKG